MEPTEQSYIDTEVEAARKDKQLRDAAGELGEALLAVLHYNDMVSTRDPSFPSGRRGEFSWGPAARAALKSAGLI